MRMPIIAVVTLLAIGCTDVTRLSDQHYPAKPKDAPIEVFYEDTPSRPYVKLAIVHTSSEWRTGGEAQITSLKKEARKLGADAILLQNVGAETHASGAVVNSNTIGSSTVTTVTPKQSTVGYGNALAIRWVEGTAAPAAVPAVPAVAPVPTAVPAAPAVAPVPAVASKGFHQWHLAINTQPVGAVVQAYDANQKLYLLGNSPMGTLWPIQSPGDVLVVFWQGRQLTLLPTPDAGVSIDFTANPPVIKGAEELPAH